VARAWEPNPRKLQRQDFVRCSRESVWNMCAIETLNAFYSFFFFFKRIGYSNQKCYQKNNVDK